MEGCTKTLLFQILSKVFGFLPYDDLATALLVCRLWRQVGEGPFLWTHFRISLEMMRMPRMAFARKLEMNEKFAKTKDEMESILNLVSENVCFKEIDVKLVDVKSVNATVLARCINSLEKVKNVKLSSSQGDTLQARN